MSQVTKCDRCGVTFEYKPFKVTETDALYRKRGKIETWLSDGKTYLFKHPDCIEYDLCPACHEALVRFLERGA